MWFTAVVRPIDLLPSAARASASYAVEGWDVAASHVAPADTSLESVHSQVLAGGLAGILHADDSQAGADYTSSVSGNLSVPACHPSQTPEPAYFLPLGALLVGLGWHRRKSRWSQA